MADEPGTTNHPPQELGKANQCPFLLLEQQHVCVTLWGRKPPSGGGVTEPNVFLRPLMELFGRRCFSTPFGGAFACSLMRFGRCPVDYEEVTGDLLESKVFHASLKEPCVERRATEPVNPLRPVGHRPRRTELQHEAPSKGEEKHYQHLSLGRDNRR
jgi:hypothetical protein